jgi:hypothetical protein
MSKSSSNERITNPSDFASSGGWPPLAPNQVGFSNNKNMSASSSTLPFVNSSLLSALPIQQPHVQQHQQQQQQQQQQQPVRRKSRGDSQVQGGVDLYSQTQPVPLEMETLQWRHQHQHVQQKSQAHSSHFVSNKQKGDGGGGRNQGQGQGEKIRASF